MITKHSIGKRATDQVRRLILRQTARPVISSIDPKLSGPPVNLYKLGDSVAVLPGTCERDAHLGPVRSYRLKPAPQARLGTADPVNEIRRAGVSESISIRPAAPRIDDGTLRHKTPASIRFALQDRSIIRVRKAPILSVSDHPIAVDAVFFERRASVVCPQVMPDAPNILRFAAVEPSAWTVDVRDVPERVQVFIPIILQREPGPLPNTLIETVSWMAEKKLLAKAAGLGLTEKDIQVLGVFKRVPISCASRIEIGPTPGNLSIFLRPKSLNRVQSSSMPLFSIAFGRVRGRQEIVRVLIPE